MPCLLRYVKLLGNGFISSTCWIYVFVIFMSKANYLTKSERIHLRMLMFLNNRFCFHCSGEMELRPTNRENLATLEHLVPRSAGGNSGLVNLRLVHKRCNR